MYLNLSDAIVAESSKIPDHYVEIDRLRKITGFIAKMQWSPDTKYLDAVFTIVAGSCLT